MSAPRLEILKLLAWSYMVPVASVWVIISFFPVFGLFGKDVSIVAALGELLFVCTGFVGLAGIAATLFLIAAPDRRGRLPNPVKNRPGLISIYTTIWLTAYAAFQFVG